MTATRSFSCPTPPRNEHRNDRGLGPLSLLLVVSLAALAAPLTASADSIGPEEEACLRKSAGDACALPNGGSGSCAASVDNRGRKHMSCEPAPKTAPSSAPASSVSPAPSASPAPSTATTTPSSKGCAFAPGQSGGALGALVILAAAFGLANRRRSAAG